MKPRDHHHQPNHFNQLKQMDMNGASSSTSPTPPLLPKKQFYVQRNGYMKDETDIVNEMNQMYIKSPFAQRRCQQQSSDGSPNPKMDAIYNNIGERCWSVRSFPFHRYNVSFRL